MLQKEKRLVMVDRSGPRRTSKAVQSEAITWDLFCEYLSDEGLNNAFHDDEYGYVYQVPSSPSALVPP